MNQEKPVHAGFLLFPPHGKIVIKKSWQAKYCLLFNASKLGIERIEVYDNAEDHTKNAPARMYTLENCVKIAQRDANNFAITTKQWCLSVGTSSAAELAEWMAALQSVAFKDNTSRAASIVEDNDLYSSSGEGVFIVKLCPSDASKRCGLEPKNYILVITSTATLLQDCNTNKTLYTWPHRYIRRYGYRDGKFTFEAGRKCDSGEGSFHLEHSNQQDIFRCLSSRMKSMRKLLNGEPSPAAVLDCGDNQFHAAMSMEARSRSPLPPSPTSSTKLRDIDSSVSSSGSSGKLLHFSDLQQKPTMPPPVNYHSHAYPLPVTKSKPAKPPRKHLPTEKKEPIYDYEPIDNLSVECNPHSYDKVELRNEAWRTFGVGDIKHTETIRADEDELPQYISWSTARYLEQENVRTPIQPAPKIIQQHSVDADDDDSYDKLRFFGSSSKLNAANSGYNQVLPIPILAGTAPVQPPSWNDYEEVQNVRLDMEAVRLADDSHLGYGMIKKVNPPKTTLSSQKRNVPNAHTVLLSDDQIPHHVVNDTAYAIISKPKRV